MLYTSRKRYKVFDVLLLKETKMSQYNCHFPSINVRQIPLCFFFSFISNKKLRNFF